jgi:hypothetical protein
MICDLLNLICLPCFDIQKHLNQINYSQLQPTKHLFQSDSISGNESIRLNDGENPGLTIEQIRIIRKIEEEKSRSGGFIRIFPSEDTFEYFSNYFHQRKLNLNQIIHQYFYPNRWKKSLPNSPENIKHIRRNYLPRAKSLSSSYHLYEKNQSNQKISSDLQHAIERYQLYHNTFLHHIHSNVIQPHKV